MKLKNIIFYFPNFSEGGVEQTSINLCNYFTSHKINIDFISYKPPKKRYFKNFKLINFKNYQNKNINWFLKNFFCLITLMKILVNNDKKNTVVFALSNLNLCILLCKIFGYRIIFRNSAPIDYFKFKPKIIEYIKFYLKCLIYPLSDLVISNSKSSATKLSNEMVFNCRIVSIPNPMSKTNNLKSNLKSNNILYVGRLSNEKGVYQLIQAFKLFLKKNKKFKLNIVGTGGQKTNIKNYILKNKLKNHVRLFNWTDNLKNFYLKSKVFILPSYFEGFGNVLIEALSYSLPCISVKNDGPKEILNNGKYGLLIKNNKPKTILNALNKLFKSYKIFARKARLGYKKNIRYDVKKVGHMYLKQINSVLY